MTKIYFKILICMVIVLWMFYFIQDFTKMEPFTPEINAIYNPSVRKLNKMYENFVNPIKETPKLILNKFYKQLKKWANL